MPDRDPPETGACSIYAVISEKFEAIVSPGDAGSRCKDFSKKTVLSEMGTVALFWESEISCDAF